MKYINKYIYYIYIQIYTRLYTKYTDKKLQPKPPFREREKKKHFGTYSLISGLTLHNNRPIRAP